MQRIPLTATERELIGKKVKTLRSEGFLPAHVFGKGLETEHVTVNAKEFLKVFAESGETGLIDLKIGEEKIRPVMVKDVQYNAVKGELLHVDFYQVNLREKVTVPVPVVLKELEEEIESVKLGEAVIIQPIMELEVEALPGDLIDQIEVDISSLKAIDDAITVDQLDYDREKLTILAEGETIVVKLDTAVTEEMQELLEEQEAEQEAALEAQEEAEAAEGGEEATEGEEGSEAGTDEAAESSDSETQEVQEESTKE